jgi:hypothetical protein
VNEADEKRCRALHSCEIRRNWPKISPNRNFHLLARNSVGRDDIALEHHQIKRLLSLESWFGRQGGLRGGGFFFVLQRSHTFSSGKLLKTAFSIPLCSDLVYHFVRNLYGREHCAAA